MSIDILVLFSLLMLSPHGQEPPAKPAAFTVDRLCGKLDRVEEIASKVDPSTVIEERKTSLGRVVMQLYQRNENSECCENLPFVAEGGGPFQLSKANTRTYWLVARWNRCESTRAILFADYQEAHLDERFYFEYLITDSVQFRGGRDV